MIRRATPWFAFFLGLIASAGPARGQDALEPLLQKATPSRKDIADIETEVGQRVRRLEDVRTTADRATARGRLTRPMATKNASPAGLTAYAAACAKELGPMTTGQKLETAMDASFVLQELNHEAAAEACAAGLASNQAAVRLISARSLQKLHPKISGSAAVCDTALRAIGESGSKEQDERVLRLLYEAATFAKDDAAFKSWSADAKALNQILGARVAQLSGGSRDDGKDDAGLRAAAACYEKCGKAEQGELGRNVFGLLTSAVDRYFEADLDPASRPALAGVIERTEKTLRDIVSASGGKLPARKVASLVGKRAASDLAKQKKEVDAVIQELRDVLKGDPWKLQ